MIHFSQLSSITKGQLVQLSKDVVVEHLVVDSRKAIVSSGAVFFAISGARNDGHHFLELLYQQGLRNFIVERNVSLPTDTNIFHASSAALALQDIAAHHRKAFSIPVIGITGSNGKTIVKEWLYQLLSDKYSVVKNPGSYNSQIGVPLSVWNMQAYHSLGLFEAGISQPGEMEKLQSVINPTLGIFTNIGSAHDEGFKSIQQKVEEKSKLFTHVECLVYCKDHLVIDTVLRTKEIKKLSWGYSSSADIHITKNGSYQLRYQDRIIELTLPFGDAASVENCFHCVAIMLYLNFSAKEIQEGIQSLRSISMRMELKEGINQCQVIDDSYNNDLAGLQVSIDFLNNQHQKQKKALILSDILQSGMEPAAWTKQVSDLIKSNTINHFVGIGEQLWKHKDLFPSSARFYRNTETFLDAFNEKDFLNEIILVKGARIFAFERIVQRLQRKVHGTIMEIDLGAMVHNLNYFRSKLQPNTKIMAMVKAFAYGSGSKEVANLLQYHKIDYLGVAYADEGVELRKNNIRLPIMVMNPSSDTFDVLLHYQLEPEVYSFSLFHALIQYLNGRACTIHIKFDTGMHRLGFVEGDVPELVRLLQQHPTIKVSSIFSHLAGADEAQHDDYSSEQAALFQRCADKLSQELGYKPIYHLLNSPGILRLSRFQFDMVRLGIGLYGIDPTSEKDKNLKPVATLKTKVSQVHKLHKGQTVGYGRHGKVLDEQQIATIAIGYADGFSRAFGKGIGKVLIKGRLVPVMGNVCMDMTMVDVTGLEVREGDEAIIFGEGLPIEQVAESIHTIPYEILTNTSERVKRVFVAESI